MMVLEFPVSTWHRTLHSLLLYAASYSFSVYYCLLTWGHPFAYARIRIFSPLALFSCLPGWSNSASFLEVLDSSFDYLNRPLICELFLLRKCREFRPSCWLYIGALPANMCLRPASEISSAETLRYKVFFLPTTVTHLDFYSVTDVWSDLPWSSFHTCCIGSIFSLEKKNVSVKYI